MNKFISSAALITISLIAISAPVKAESESAERIAPTINYFLNMLDVERTFKDPVMKEAGSDPFLVKLFSGALNNFSTMDLARRLAMGLDSVVKADEIAPCSKFITSPAAVALAKAQAEQPVRNANSFLLSYRSLPKDKKAMTNDFFSSSCARKVTDYLNSEKARQIGRVYGEELVCMHVKSINQEMLDNLKRNGKCL